jgi:hypothetical protein
MPYPPRPQLRPMPEFVGTAVSRPDWAVQARVGRFVLEQYAAGRSLREIAELTDRSWSAVRNILHKHGVRRRLGGALDIKAPLRGSDTHSRRKPTVAIVVPKMQVMRVKPTARGVQTGCSAAATDPTTPNPAPSKNPPADPIPLAVLLLARLASVEAAVRTCASETESIPWRRIKRLLSAVKSSTYCSLHS